MGATDFRTFVDRLASTDELFEVRDEVDWDLEVGARTRAEAASRNRAVLFERIRGYPDARIVTNAMGSPARIGLALGLEPGRSFREVRRTVRARLERPVAPVADDGSSAQRRTYRGDDVDLTLLPVPRWSDADAGRFLGTWHVNITADPVSGARNLGVYRMQLVDRVTALVSVSAGSHLVAHMRRAEERGADLEMAVAIGVEEPLVLAAGMAVSPEVDELSLAGALTGAPVRLRRAETVDLDVPADAEIVLEGHLVCGARMQEGPFVDYAGTPTSNPGALVFRVSLLSMRDAAIFRGAAIGRLRAEDHLVYTLLASAGCLDFHGSRARHHLQGLCLRAGWYRPFQWLGRVHPPAVLKTRRRRSAHD
jgi:4-hydroxy-3-polyprenylbenzoate decarboxylase